jgi:hypothetical protein
MGSTESAVMAAQAMSVSPRSPMVWRRVFPGAPEQARQAREHGYGLLTVGHLATSWGWRGTARGRTVTAVFHRDGP